MFQKTRMLYFYVETPLHSGSGRGLGAVDLPIQRERTTQYPMVQASSVKGCLRAEADPAQNHTSPLSAAEFEALFGPETSGAAAFSGALSLGDARLLLLPVRSLAGVFAWATSLDVLARFEREARRCGLNLPWTVAGLAEPAADRVWAAANSDLKIPPDQVVLEEFSFTLDLSQAALTTAVGGWLAENALPLSAAMPEYAYWQAVLPTKLCILPEDSFRDFALYAMEIQTHIKLNPATKTVDHTRGALWTSESLPVDSLLYAPLMATASRNQNAVLDAAAVMTRLASLNLTRLQMGGDETTGQGIVAVRLSS